MNIMIYLLAVLLVLIVIHYVMTKKWFKPSYRVKYYSYSMSPGVGYVKYNFPYRGQVKFWYLPFWVQVNDFISCENAADWLNNVENKLKVNSLKVNSSVIKQI